MEHSLITTLAVGFGLALVFGFIAERLKLPSLVGYLLAGIIVGPATAIPGLTADPKIAKQLSEVGVMLLMFGVGMHFSFRDLLSVRRIAVPGAIFQTTVATCLGLGMAMLWGWDFGSGLVLGLSLSVASTVVLLKALEARGILDSMNGRIAVGWLVVEDLITVLVLVMLPPLAAILGGNAGDAAASSDIPLSWAVAKTFLGVAAFIALMLIVGKRALPWLLWQVAKTGSRELFTLAVVAIGIGIAYAASEFFGVSFALGAFFAGTVMRESEFSHRAAEESLPLRDAFSVLFFVAVGMLFKPEVIVNQPWHLLGVVAIIVVGKSLAASFLVLLFRYRLETALTVSAGLAQVGEFSFILVDLGHDLQLLSEEGVSLVLAAALITIALNPVAFAAIGPLRTWLLKRSAFIRKLELREDPLAELPMTTETRYLEGQAVLVGYGRVGRNIAKGMDMHGIPYVIVEQNRETVENLRAQGLAAVSGDAADPAVLVQAHIANAAMLVIAVPDAIDIKYMVDTAKTLNPGILVAARCRNDEEADIIRADVNKCFLAEEELAAAMSKYVLHSFLTEGGAKNP